MDTNALKKFAQAARNLLIDQVTSKLDLVLVDGSAAWREHPQAMKDLDAAIARDSRQQVIEQVAYTWFNRFTALQFMDANDYTSVGIVSPADGQTRPEILSEAMAGNFPEDAPEKVVALLDGRIPSSDPQAEAYRLLLVHACNQWHGPMPFLFEQIDDYSELLMPEDLLSQTSILAEVRAVMTDDACQDVEIIGWLYQFYISEKKDQVFAGLKKNVKITAENIPAATQLFTPHWIVRYLVENSLGRLWLLNRPQSRLAERMDYYIAPEEPETDFLRISRPEDIRICDPAAGSGHMLTYAFDLLYAIYEEEGYDATEIPSLILTHNLTGVEIDDRAGALGAFALAMKAAAKLGRRRFLRMEAKPDICVLQNVSFTEAEMQDVAAVVGKDLFTDELRETLGQFEQAKNFGSLIVPKLRDPAEALRVVVARDFSSDLLLKDVQERVVAVLRMAEALSPKYHVVVANPPYMGGRGVNGKLKNFLRESFTDFKSDVFSAFVVRCGEMSERSAYVGIMCPNVWMYISSHEKLRSYLTEKRAITNLVELPLTGFKGATVQICAYNFINLPQPKLSGNYVRLVDFKGGDIEMAELTLKAIRNRDCGWFYHYSADNFSKIPGSPIAYWSTEATRAAFSTGSRIEDIAPARAGLQTGENEKFVRFWFEVEQQSSGLNYLSKADAKVSDRKWFPYNSGGAYRRWFGNNEKVVDWGQDGKNIKDDKLRKLEIGLCLPSNSKPKNEQFYFLPSVTWTMLSSSYFGVRICRQGFVFDIAGSSVFPDNNTLNAVAAFLNSKLAELFLKYLNPTMNAQSGDIGNFPWLDSTIQGELSEIDGIISRVRDLSQSDWDAYETLDSNIKCNG